MSNGGLSYGWCFLWQIMSRRPVKPWGAGCLAAETSPKDAPTTASVSMFSPSHACYATTIMMCNSVTYPTLGVKLLKTRPKAI
jgi:hypothetical protein